MAGSPSWSPPLLEVVTVSGTVYRLGGGTVERAPTDGAPMRGDGLPIGLVRVETRVVGEPAVLLVAPLRDGVDVTARRTTPVAEVRWCGPTPDKAERRWLTAVGVPTDLLPR